MPVCAPPMPTEPASITVRGGCQTRGVQALVKPAKIGEPGKEAQHVDKVIVPGVQGDYLADGKAGMLRHCFDIGAEGASVAYGNFDHAF